MQNEIVAGCFDMIDFLGFEEQDAVGRFDQDARAASGAAAQSGEQAGQVRLDTGLGSRLELFTSPLQGFLKAGLFEGLEEVVQRVDFESADGVLVVGGGENDGGHQ